MLSLNRLFIVALLLSTQRLALHAETPEMWVVPLEHKIPSRTPDGHEITSLGFVVRIRGAGDYKMINFLSVVRIKIVNSSGKPLLEHIEGNVRLPIHSDVSPLATNELAERVYTIRYLTAAEMRQLFNSSEFRGDALVFSDGDGNAQYFEDVTMGKFKVEVLFSDPIYPSYSPRGKFEHDYGQDDFFRGPVKMSFEIEVGDIEKQ